DREWVILARDVMGDAALAANPDFATNVERVRRRDQTDGRVAASFGSMDVEELSAKLSRADIAFARVNDPASLATHPHLQRITVGTRGGELSYPAPARDRQGETRSYGRVPALGEHTAKIRAEFGS